MPGFSHIHQYQQRQRTKVTITKCPPRSPREPSCPISALYPIAPALAPAMRHSSITPAHQRAIHTSCSFLCNCIAAAVGFSNASTLFSPIALLSQRPIAQLKPMLVQREWQREHPDDGIRFIRNKISSLPQPVDLLMWFSNPAERGAIACTQNCMHPASADCMKRGALHAPVCSGLG